MPELASGSARPPAPPDPASRCDGRPASSPAPASPTGGGAPAPRLLLELPARQLEALARAWAQSASHGQWLDLAVLLRDWSHHDLGWLELAARLARDPEERARYRAGFSLEPEE